MARDNYRNPFSLRPPTQGGTLIHADFGARLADIAVGARMPDGTLCYDVDAGAQTALYVRPEIICGRDVYALPGESMLVHILNSDRSRNHGHDDWRVPSAGELEKLCRAWSKVASGAPPLPLWSTTRIDRFNAVAQQPGADARLHSKICRYAVPSVRSGPIRV